VTQVFTAPLNNPALKAMIPIVTPSDPGGFWPMRHGGISLGMLEWAMVVEGRTTRGFPKTKPSS
jgi:predicted acyl esterase